MNQAADTIGQRLRAERERRAVSVEKAADDLHFDLSIVEALEAGDFARLGPSVYGKGHLKRYAEYLGLPSGELLEAFANRAAEPPAVGAAGSALHMPADPSDGGDPTWIPAAGVAAATLVIAVVVWWKPWHAPAPAATPGAAGLPQPAAAPAEPAAVPPLETDPIDGATPATAEAPGREPGAPASVARAAAPPAEPIAGTGRAKLRLRFSADSWVDVHDASGVRVFAGKGSANSVKTIAGTAPMRVYIGFASGVQLEVNNHAVAIGPQFVAGDVARFEAGADGVLRRDPRPRDVAARNPPPRP